MKNPLPNHQPLLPVLALLLPWFAATAIADSELPRLSIEQLQYQGAFRLPKETFGESSVNYSDGAIGYRPDRNSLFVAGHEKEFAIAEFDIPDLSTSRNIGSLPIAKPPLQAFASVLDRADGRPDGDLVINGIHWVDGSLLINVYRFYDQSPFNRKTTLVLHDADSINSSSTSGYFSLEGYARAAGWITPVPDEWQERLGGTHLTGFSNSTLRAMIHSSSVGPSAYSLNVQDIAESAEEGWTASTISLLDYPLDQTLAPDGDLYNTSGNNKVWTHASEASFGLAVPGTSTLLVVGMSGGHNSGMSYGDPPYGGYKGHYTIAKEDKYGFYWLYDLNDLARSKERSVPAYEARPYDYGVLPAPIDGIDYAHFAGGSYDADSGTIYLSIKGADRLNGTGSAPVITAYRIDN